MVVKLGLFPYINISKCLVKDILYIEGGLGDIMVIEIQLNHSQIIIHIYMLLQQIKM